MRSFSSKIRFTPHLRSAVVAALALLLAFAPYRSMAQASPAAPANSSAAGAPSHGSSASDSSSSHSEEEAFLHSPVIQSIARVLGLDVQTTSHIFLVINFAVIFFAIVIPLGRVMPRVFRKRSQTLSHALDAARAATADANARLSVVEAKLAGLGEEIRKFRAEMENDSLEDEKRIKASLKEESERIVTAAEQEIAAAATHARRSLREFAADLAIDHATKQIKLTPETDRALIDEFIGQVAAENGQSAAAAAGGKK